MIILAGNKNDKQNSSLKELEKLVYSKDKDLIDVEKKFSSINADVNNISLRYNGEKNNSNIIDFINSIDFNSELQNNNAGMSVTKKLNKDFINDMLNNQNAMDLFSIEKDRIDRYSDYRLLESYIPQVSLCLDVYTDCILSPDDFTKDSVSFKYAKGEVSEKSAEVYRNIENLEKKYKLKEKYKMLTRDGLTLGDQFVAIFKLDKEINTMLNSNVLNEKKENPLFPRKKVIKEETYNITNELLLESEIKIKDESRLNELYKEYCNTFLKENDKNENSNKTNYTEKLKKTVVESINENVKFYQGVENIMDVDKNDIINSNSKKTNKEQKVNLNGSIIKILKPENVVKLEMDGIEFGYIYVEKQDTEKELTITSTQTELSYNNSDIFMSRYDIESKEKGTGMNEKDKLITDIFVNGIAKRLDKKIIEKNKDFKNFIYSILKKDYIVNKRLKIVFLENDEVKHLKIDSNNVYGVSKLARSLFFGKLYLGTLLTEVMQKISRSRDKRIIYVETGLDNDLEGAVQSVIEDFKNKELSVDTLKTITTVLNNCGSFEDYYLPVIDGQAPINFDTLSGMDVNVDDDFLQFLLKSMITGMGIPFNYIDSSNDVDFAKTLIMQNSTFVRTIVSYQSYMSRLFTDIIQTLYYNEYSSLKDYNNDHELIEAILPVPSYLAVSNLNEQVSNAQNTIDFVVSSYISDDTQDPDLKIRFRNKVTREFLPNLDWNKFDKIFDSVKIDKEETELENNIKNPATSGGDDMSGMEDMSGF